MCDCTQWRIYIIGVMAGPECCFQTSLNSELLCIHGISIHAWIQEMVTCAHVQEITQEMAQVLIPRCNEWQKCSRTGARNGTRDSRSTHVSMVQVLFLGCKKWHKHSHLCCKQWCMKMAQRIAQVFTPMCKGRIKHSCLGTRDSTNTNAQVHEMVQVLMPRCKSWHRKSYPHTWV